MFAYIQAVREAFMENTVFRLESLTWIKMWICLTFEGLLRIPSAFWVDQWDNFLMSIFLQGRPEKRTQLETTYWACLLINMKYEGFGLLIHLAPFTELTCKNNRRTHNVNVLKHRFFCLHLCFLQITQLSIIVFIIYSIG